MKKKYSISVDFDGVIHQYTTPWVSASVIPDPPMPGAFKWLEEMDKHFHVIIHSARLTPRADDGPNHGLVAIYEWFKRHSLPQHVLEQLEFWTDPGKPTALIYIDDRGYRFEGRFPTKGEIHRMKPWKLRSEDGG